MSKYKSQTHLLDGGKGKFSALGFSHLDIKSGIITQKSQIQQHQCYTPGHPKGYFYNKRKTATFCYHHQLLLTSHQKQVYQKESELHKVSSLKPCICSKTWCFHVSTFSLKWPQENFWLSWTGLQLSIQVPDNTHIVHMKLQSSLTSGRSLNPVHRKIHPYYWC